MALSTVVEKVIVLNSLGVVAQPLASSIYGAACAGSRDAIACC